MNKPSVKTRPAAKPSRTSVVSKAVSRQVSARPEPNNKAVTTKTATINKAAASTPIAVPQTTSVRSQVLRTHKFRVGQTVLYTSSPVSRPGATGTYKVVKLLPSDGDDYQYRIKNPGEAFERVAKESQLELDH